MKTNRIVATAASLAVLLAATPVAAQMFERAFSFGARDRASLAVIMKQVESGMFKPQRQQSSSNSSILPPSYNSSSSLEYTVNNLICSGDSGSANADANSACIILNGSTGTIGARQNSIGAQNATSDVGTTEVTGTEENMSESLETASDNGGTNTETVSE